MKDVHNIAPVRLFLIGLAALPFLVLAIGIMAWTADRLLENEGCGSAVGTAWVALGWSGSHSWTIAVTPSELLAILLFGVALGRGLAGVCDRNDADAKESMFSAWCKHGGDGAAPVLALMPIRGGLCFVSGGWVRLATFGAGAPVSICLSSGGAVPRSFVLEQTPIQKATITT